MWNCLWGHALKRSPGINRKSRVSYPGPGFLSSATWPWLPKKHYNGLNQTNTLCKSGMNPISRLTHKCNIFNADTNEHSDVILYVLSKGGGFLLCNDFDLD